MNTIRVQARLLLGALIAAVLALTLVPATSSAAPADSAKPSTAVKTERLAATAKTAPATAPAVDARRDCYVPNCYGAISMNMRTLKTFGGYNYGTRHNAERSQYKRCTRSASNPANCKKIVWVRNGCAAVAVKPRTGGGYKYAWATGYRTMAAAKYWAKKRLRPGKPQVLAALCTSRRY